MTVGHRSHLNAGKGWCRVATRPGALRVSRGGWHDERVQTTYRLDRRFVLTSVGVQMIGAGVAAMLAFTVWGPLGVLTVLLLLNAVRVVVLPPAIARTEQEGARLGGPESAKPVRLLWGGVENVSVDRGHLVFDRGDASTVVFSLMYLGGRGDDFVRDVYERLNTANGYRRFDPSAS